MKKTLEAELMSLAHRILQLKDRTDIHELKAVTGVLYEKLTVLSFTEKHFAGAQPTIGKKQVEEALEEHQEFKTAVEDAISSEEKPSEKPVESTQAQVKAEQNARPNGTKHDTEAISETNPEQLEDIVEEMPADPDPIEEAPEETPSESKPEEEEDDAIEETPSENKPENDGSIEETRFESKPKEDDPFEEMPSESKLEEDDDIEETSSESKPEDEDDIRNIGVHYDDLPQFEPVPRKKPATPAPTKPKSTEQETPKPSVARETPEVPKQKNTVDLFSHTQKKEVSTRNTANPHKASLNDRLKKGITIGLNDRLTYIKHLFEGNAADYNRVLSQLNTIDSYDEAQRFIEQVVKPDYNQWEGKEVYENKFLQVIENKFE